MKHTASEEIISLPKPVSDWSKVVTGVLEVAIYDSMFYSTRSKYGPKTIAKRCAGAREWLRKDGEEVIRQLGNLGVDAATIQGYRGLMTRLEKMWSRHASPSIGPGCNTHEKRIKGCRHCAKHFRVAALARRLDEPSRS